MVNCVDGLPNAIYTRKRGGYAICETTAAAEPAEGPVSESSSSTKDIPLDCWDIKCARKARKGLSLSVHQRRDAGWQT